MSLCPGILCVGYSRSGAFHILTYRAESYAGFDTQHPTVPGTSLSSLTLYNAARQMLSHGHVNTSFVDLRATAWL